MKNTKRLIGVWLLFLVVGVAVVSTNLVGNVNTPIAGNPDDFLVYFSNALIDGDTKAIAVRDEKTLVFSGELSEVGSVKVISYDVTNASKLYDARVSITCTGSNDYLKFVNSFDEKNDLTARSTKSGTLTIELLNAVISNTNYEVSCTINATAIERDTQGSGDVSSPLEKRFAIGDEVLYRGEKFNVVMQEEDKVSLLTAYVLGTDYKQSTTQNNVMFSEVNGWAKATEIDIQSYEGPAKTYVNQYVSYLQNATSDNTITGDLISTSLLYETLGCTQDGYTCKNSRYIEWLHKGQPWWTKSAYGTNGVYRVFGEGIINGNYYAAETSGIRPVITVSKSTLDNMINEASRVCQSHGYSYAKDNGSRYQCSDYEDFSGGCYYTYDDVFTGECDW